MGRSPGQIDSLRSRKKLQGPSASLAGLPVRRTGRMAMGIEKMRFPAEQPRNVLGPEPLHTQIRLVRHSSFV